MMPLGPHRLEPQVLAVERGKQYNKVYANLTIVMCFVVIAVAVERNATHYELYDKMFLQTYNHKYK